MERELTRDKTTVKKLYKYHDSVIRRMNNNKLQNFEIIFCWKYLAEYQMGFLLNRSYQLIAPVAHINRFEYSYSNHMGLGNSYNQKMNFVLFKCKELSIN